MAFIPSETAQNTSQQSVIQPILILEIEGIPVLFGSQDISKIWRFDEGYLFDDGLRFDDVVQDDSSRDYINLKTTSKNVSQQVFPDREGTSSTLVMDIGLIDFNGEVTELFKQGNNVEDLLGQKASVFVGFKGTAHPEDSIPLLNGYINKITPNQGGYVVNVAHSENKKRQKIFKQYTSTLTSSITDVQTTIPVTSTNNFLESADSLTSYIQINDEIMEVVSVDSETQFTVVRSRLNTVASTHSNDDDISSVYGLSGNAIDLSLKLYLSGGDEYFDTITATSFNQVNSDLIANTIFFQDILLSSEFNVFAGDTILSSGATNGANNGTFTISEVVEVSNGSYIVCSGAGFVLETTTSASIQFKSQYNVLPVGAGCGLDPFDVDIQSHIDELNENSASFPNYQFYLKDDIEAKTFVDKELYFPSGLYSINRKAKISCRFTRPPLANENVPVFNSENIINIDKIKVTRSTTNFMYNSIVYKFEKSVRDDEFKAGNISVNPTAKARTDNIDHTLTIESEGLRRNADTVSLIDRQSNRFYQRYQYGAIAYNNIKVLFKDAWNLEIGDVIEFGGTDVKIPDLQNGTTYTPRKFLEIISRDINLETQEITFNCLETGFDLNARFGVFSPSSYITANSTTSKLELELSFFTGSVITERQKWQNYVGERIRVRSEDYTFDEIVTIDSLAPENDEVINVSPPLSSVSAGYLIEIPTYDETSDEIDETYKKRYTYTNLQSVITSVTDAQTFEVTDGTQFKAGGLIQVRAEDYSDDSGDAGEEILSINVNEITLVNALDFTPSVGYVVEKLTYLDDGFRYSLI